MKVLSNSRWNRVKAFLMCLVLLLPFFAFIGCTGSDGSSGSGGGSGRVDPSEYGMVELTEDDKINLKYLYKPDDITEYADEIAEEIYRSSENIINNLVGEYGVGSVEVYNEQYNELGTTTYSLSPFYVNTKATYSSYFNRSSMGDGQFLDLISEMSRCGFALYDGTNSWYAIGTTAISPSFISFTGTDYTISRDGTLKDMSSMSDTAVNSGAVIGSQGVFRFSTGSDFFYIWLGSSTSVVTANGYGVGFTSKLIDTHYNAIQGTVKSVTSGLANAVVISKESWAWALPDDYIGDYLTGYQEAYQDLLSVNIARLIAFGNAELPNDIQKLYDKVDTAPIDSADMEAFMAVCIERIDHIGLSKDEGRLVSEFILNNVIGEEIYLADEEKYTPPSDYFAGNEIANGYVRLLFDGDEYRNIIIPDETAAGSTDNGFKRSDLFYNFYNTVHASLERTRLVYIEKPIVDYLDVEFGVDNAPSLFGDIESDEDVDEDADGNNQPINPDPSNGKIQSIVITTDNSKEIQFGRFDFSFTTVCDAKKYKWTVDTLDIYIQFRYFHDGVLVVEEVDCVYLSVEEPTNENGIPSQYGEYVEKTYTIKDIEDSPALNDMDIYLKRNEAQSFKNLATDVWKGLENEIGTNADIKNSIKNGTYQHFDSINNGVGNSTAYGGEGDYVEFCFIVDSSKVSLKDYYNYAVTLQSVYGKIGN